MALTVLAIDIPSPTISLFAKVVLGALVFALTVLILDGELRRLVFGYAARVLGLLRRQPAVK